MVACESASLSSVELRGSLTTIVLCRNDANSGATSICRSFSIPSVSTRGRDMLPDHPACSISVRERVSCTHPHRIRSIVAIGHAPRCVISTMVQQSFFLGVEAEVELIVGTNLPARSVFRGVEENMFVPEGEE